jgi:hypothetical protein
MAFVEITNKSYGKPLAILSECCFGFYPFMSTPFIAIYENGHIIYKKYINENSICCYEAILSKSEIEHIINVLPFEQIYKIKELDIYANKYGYEVITDQPLTILELNINDYKKIRIDGAITKKTRKYVPESYLKIYDFLINYKNEKAVEWYPDKLCVKFNEPYSDEKYFEWSSILPKINIDSPKDDRGNIHLYLYNQDVKTFLTIYKDFVNHSNIKFENEYFCMFYEIEFPNIEYGESMCFEDNG